LQEGVDPSRGKKKGFFHAETDSDVLALMNMDIDAINPQGKRKDHIIDIVCAMNPQGKRKIILESIDCRLT
jgi:hypothetical protein